MLMLGMKPMPGMSGRRFDIYRAAYETVCLEMHRINELSFKMANA